MDKHELSEICRENRLRDRLDEIDRMTAQANEIEARGRDGDDITARDLRRSANVLAGYYQ